MRISHAPKQAEIFRQELREIDGRWVAVATDHALERAYDSSKVERDVFDVGAHVGELHREDTSIEAGE